MTLVKATANRWRASLAASGRCIEATSRQQFSIAETPAPPKPNSYQDFISASLASLCSVPVISDISPGRAQCVSVLVARRLAAPLAHVPPSCPVERPTRGLAWAPCQMPSTIYLQLIILNTMRQILISTISMKIHLLHPAMAIRFRTPCAS